LTADNADFLSSYSAAAEAADGEETDSAEEEEKE